MADPLSYPDDDNGGGVTKREKGTPRWMSVVAIVVAILLVLVFAYLHLAGIVGPSAH
jgi:hypothetical protein